MQREISRRQFLNGATDLVKFGAGFLIGGRTMVSLMSNILERDAALQQERARQDSFQEFRQYEINYVNQEAEHEYQQTLLKLTSEVPNILYIPESNATRPIIDPTRHGIPIRRILTIPEFTETVKNDLDTIITIMEVKKDNPIINPRLDELLWSRLDRRSDNPDDMYESDFSPATLLNFLKVLRNDIQKKWVVVSSGTFEDATAQNSRELSVKYHTETKLPYFPISRVLVEFSDKGLRNNKYPQLDGSGTVGMSNLNALILLAYEYSHGLIDVAIDDFLEVNGVFQLKNTQTPQDAEWIIAEFKQYLFFYKGYRLSGDQNYLQILFQQSLGALCGDPYARLIGLERNESWLPYIYFMAAVHRGDYQAMKALQDILVVQAKY